MPLPCVVGAQAPEYPKQIRKFEPTRCGNRRTAGKTEADDRNVKQTCRTLIKYRLQELLPHLLSRRVSLKYLCIFGYVPLWCHFKYFAYLSRFYTEKSNVMQVCHVRRSWGHTVLNVSRGSLYFGPVSGVLWSTLLTFDLICLFHVVR